MINPNDVNLIIFDMDGTIIPSLPAVYESIKRTFKKLGWAVNFGSADINRFFGMPSTQSGGGLYEFITPPESHLPIPEVRERVRQEYTATFREMAQPYPGVRETLTILRKRGYHLVQYTNAATSYLEMVMSTLDTGKYFDHIECVHENDLTKTELVAKIKQQFGGLTAAVVGDRFHDIEAARETGSLSIGVLFGYGESEPEQADVTIEKFDDLLAIFDRKLPIFQSIAEEVEKKKPKDKAFVIGINGIDGAGKTKFAASLEVYLNTRGYKTQLIRMDDFHNPKAIRYAGADQEDNYYHKSFNINLIIEKLLTPIKGGKPLSLKYTALDLNTDKFEIEKTFNIDRDTVVIFEGVFLFRKGLAPYLDYKVFLDIPFEESKRRANVRDSEADVIKYDIKYLPAQRKYLEACPPRETADMIIDNSNWEYPHPTLP
jgi:uridine kinase